ncbi:UPF0223 family protein [Carnobacterium gallinarum]|uniref:UPF0223 family protein n=1 Tax=Carnobacterium gallinarum TaxID=2749 RepID=UPI000550FFB0|nr:UPF0223 family protein [Carnobacterium gallinarum]
MDKSYSYPIDLDWSQEEMVQVIDLWRMVELAYEKGINREEFLKKYQTFKKVIPAIGEEKKWGREFESISGYSLYKVVKEAKESNYKTIKL